jgi:hypothetical protein
LQTMGVGKLAVYDNLTSGKWVHILRRIMIALVYTIYFTAESWR